MSDNGIYTIVINKASMLIGNDTTYRPQMMNSSWLQQAAT
jgi:hypothetical protein